VEFLSVVHVIVAVVEVVEVAIEEITGGTYSDSMKPLSATRL